MLCSAQARSARTSATVSYLYDDVGRAYAGSYESTKSGVSNRALFRVMTDDHGDVLALADASGDTFAKYSYGVFGESESTSSRASTVIPSTLAAEIAAANRLRYAGYDFDPWSGVYYLQARYYDPATKQFLSRDPIGADGEESAYQYCGGNPVELIDPTGEVADYSGSGTQTRLNSLANAAAKAADEKRKKALRAAAAREAAREKARRAAAARAAAAKKAAAAKVAAAKKKAAAAKATAARKAAAAAAAERKAQQQARTAAAAQVSAQPAVTPAAAPARAAAPATPRQTSPLAEGTSGRAVFDYAMRPGTGLMLWGAWHVMLGASMIAVGGGVIGGSDGPGAVLTGGGSIVPGTATGTAAIVGGSHLIATGVGLGFAGAIDSGLVDPKDLSVMIRD